MSPSTAAHAGKMCGSYNKCDMDTQAYPRKKLDAWHRPGMAAQMLHYVDPTDRVATYYDRARSFLGYSAPTTGEHTGLQRPPRGVVLPCRPTTTCRDISGAGFVPLPYQTSAANMVRWMIEVGQGQPATGRETAGDSTVPRGLLLWHSVGSGKTNTTKLILQYLATNPKMDCFLLTTDDNLNDHGPDELLENGWDRVWNNHHRVLKKGSDHGGPENRYACATTFKRFAKLMFPRYGPWDNYISRSAEQEADTSKVGVLGNDYVPPTGFQGLRATLNDPTNSDWRFALLPRMRSGVWVDGAKRILEALAARDPRADVRATYTNLITDDVYGRAVYTSLSCTMVHAVSTVIAGYGFSF